MKLKELREYLGLFSSIIWIVIYSFILRPYYQLGDIRFFLFLGIIIGFWSNLFSQKGRFDKILMSLFSLIIVGFIYEWNFYIANEVLGSSYSFIYLIVKGFYSVEQIISFSIRFLSAIDSSASTVYVIAICSLIISNIVNLKKIKEVIDFEILFSREGKNPILITLAAIIILSLVKYVIEVIQPQSLNGSLLLSQKAHYHVPSYFSFIAIVFICLFSFVKVYGLYLLVKMRQLNLFKTIIIYFVVLFSFQCLFSVITSHRISLFHFRDCFDNSILNVLEMLVLTFLMNKFKPIVSFTVTTLCIWFVYEVYQSFLYAPKNLIAATMFELPRIYIPISAGLIGGLTYICLEKLLIKKRNLTIANKA